MSDLIEDGMLLSEDELIRAGFNLIQQAISIFDADLRLRVWNSSFIEMFDLPESIAYRGAYLESIFRYLAVRGEYGPGDIVEQVRERLDQAKAFKPLYLERVRPDGTVISVEGFPLSNGGWVTVYTDITVQKRHQEFLEEHSDRLSDRLLEHSAMLTEANRKLQASNRSLAEVKRDLSKSENRMREITQALPAHIAYLTPDYKYTYSNNRFSDIIGIDHPIVVGKSVAEIFGPQAFADIEPFLKRALRGKQSVIEFEFPPDSPDAQIIRTTFTPERDENDTIKGVFVLSLNITEEVQAMEAHIQSKRMETTVQLTTGLAHDFSNILTVILGNLKHIDSEFIDEFSRKTLISATQKAAQRAVRIIEQLLSFTGKKNLAPKETNISLLINELAKLFAPSLSSDASLNIVLPDEPVTAFVDESALQDVLVNLLLNANDAIDNNGCITVSTENFASENGEEMAQIIVSDDGCGFDVESLERAFEPFFTSKQEKGGSGLGLSMAQGFAVQSGGSIRIDSQKGEGASVILELPCREQAKQKEES